MKANEAIAQYVDENYDFLDLEIDKAKYNFKDSTYMARAESRTSVDTKFSIHYRDGQVIRDDYELIVSGKFNTLERLSNEYSSLAKNIVAEELGYENNTSRVMYKKHAYENANNQLELDMKFDRTLPLETEVTIRLDLIDHSLENIAKVLIYAHEAFSEKDCQFNEYNLYAENDGRQVIVYGVTPHHIESRELVSLLEQEKNNDTADGINVYIKGE